MRAVKAFLFVGLLVISSCKPEFVEPEIGKVDIRINHMIDNETFAFNTEYDFDGQTVEFTDFRYYISNITFQGEDGSEKDAPTKKAWLVGPEDNVLNLGEIEDRSLFQTDFLIGLDAETNHSDPTMASEEDLMNNEMHWAWNPTAGYKFIRIEGTIDGVVFGYHAATDNQLGEITDLEIAAFNEVDQTVTVDILFDVRALFEGMTLVSGQHHGENQITGGLVNNIESNAVFQAQ